MDEGTQYHTCLHPIFSMATPSLFDHFRNQGIRIMNLEPEKGTDTIRLAVEVWRELTGPPG